MEITLAVVVVAAVVFFGALISLGNERQRKAIDSLREQAVLWAIEDLRIKRQQLAHDVHVDDPLGWFNKVATRVCGQNLDLQFVEAFESPQVFVCTRGDTGSRVIFTLLSPSRIGAMKRTKQSQLSRYADHDPLLLFPRRLVAFECSILNSGILFDLELAIAWHGLTGQKMTGVERVWMYFL